MTSQDTPQPAQDHQEYDDDLIAVLESVWGEGFMSPGGAAEVDRILNGFDLSGISKCLARRKRPDIVK